MSELRIFQDAVAIVTGGASGIGKALSEDLCRRGATVVIADRQLALATEVAAAITEGGGQCSAVELDVTDAAAFQRVVDDVAGEHGRLDYLFNNAGIAFIGPFRRMKLEEHLKLVDVNVKGVLHGICAVYDRMRAQGYGHIVNTASISGVITAPWFATYGATKHAVVGLTKNLRAESEHEQTGVRVSALCPGFIRTAMVSGGQYGGMYVEATNEQKVDRGLLPPEILASKSLDQVAKNRELIIVPGWWRWSWFLSKLIPGLESRGARTFLGRSPLRELPEHTDTSA